MDDPELESDEAADEGAKKKRWNKWKNAKEGERERHVLESCRWILHLNPEQGIVALGGFPVLRVGVVQFWDIWLDCCNQLMGSDRRVSEVCGMRGADLMFSN